MQLIFYANVLLGKYSTYPGRLPAVGHIVYSIRNSTAGLSGYIYILSVVQLLSHSTIECGLAVSFQS